MFFWAHGKILERANRSKIFPCALENIGADTMRFQCSRDHVLAKIMMGFIQQLDQSRAVENINSHRGEESLVLRPKAELRIPIRTQLELILYRGIFRFLDEFR